MSKYISLLILAAGCFITVNAQSTFIIKGNVKDLQDNTKLLLTYRNAEDHKIKDSAFVKNEKFEFKGTVNRPVLATVSLYYDDDADFRLKTMIDKQSFYLASGKTFIKGDADLRSANISGGITQKEFLLLESQLKPYSDQMASIQKKLFANEYAEEQKKQVYDQLADLRQKMNNTEERFREGNPDSYISFDMVKAKASMIKPEIFEPVFYALSERLRNMPEGQVLESRLMLAKKLSPGQTAIDFVQKNSDGKDVSLSSYRGKYVLLDFWASWCGPCRDENPHVLKAYNRFKERNFDVLGVSLDEDRGAWLKAIKEDGMPWTQVSDLMGTNNTVALKYGVKAIPQNFLINPAGVIIATNLRGEQLEKTLAEMIKDK